MIVDYPLVCSDMPRYVQKFTDNTSFLKDVLSQYRNPVMIEIGSWLGFTTIELLQKMPNLHIYCVDPWETTEYTINISVSKYREKYKEDKDYIFKQFIRNTWDFRNRITIVKGYSPDILDEIKDVKPNLVYIDGAHDIDSVTKDITKVLTLYPKAVICGDDAHNTEVQRALISCKKPFKTVPPFLWHYDFQLLRKPCKNCGKSRKAFIDNINVKLSATQYRQKLQKDIKEKISKLDEQSKAKEHANFSKLTNNLYEVKDYYDYLQKTYGSVNTVINADQLLK